MLIRSFVAININEKVRNEISNLQTALKNEIKHNIRWVDPVNMHLTLKFLGEIPESSLASLYSAISHATSGISSFNLSFKGMGVFPNIKNPRVIWVSVDEGKEEISSLYNRINRSLETLGFNNKKTKSPFTAHLTLGRVKSSLKNDNLSEVLYNHAAFTSTLMVVQKIVFFKSILRREGPLYVPLKEFLLS